MPGLRIGVDTREAMILVPEPLRRPEARWAEPAVDVLSRECPNTWRDGSLSEDIHG